MEYQENCRVASVPRSGYLIMVLPWWLQEAKDYAKLGARWIWCLNEIKLQRHMGPEFGLGLVSRDGHHLGVS